MNDTIPSLFRWIPGIIRRDFLRKLIALVFAGMLWWNVSQQIGSEHIIRNVPVVISAPTGIEILDNDTPRRIDVTVRSSQRRINLLQPTDLKVVATIHPSQIQGGQEALILRLGKDNVQGPAGVAIVGLRPDNLTVNLDRRGTRRLPVRGVVSGALMDNYAYGEVKVLPPEVTVTGPEGTLRQIDEIQTRPVILQRENTSAFETEVELVSPRRNLHVTPAQVNVQIEIYRKYETRNLRGVRVGVLQPEGRAAKLVPRFAYDKVDISLRGVKDAIHDPAISEQAIRPFVDLSGIDSPGTYQLPVQLWLGIKDIEAQEIKPDTIEVRMEAR
jgi:YbbR domain-containing protein